MTPRDHLHKLVDDLPDPEVHAAERFLAFLAKHGDPLMAFLDRAAVDDEAVTPDDEAAIAEGQADREAGRVVSADEAKRRLLG